MTLNRRQFGRNLALAALGVWGGSAADGAPQAPNADADLWFVSPELRPYARKYGGGKDYTFAQVYKEQAEQAKEKVVIEKRPAVVKQWVPVPGGPPVAVYMTNVQPGASRPAIVHTHGGGFFLGDAISCVPAIQEWAKELDCFAATVEYRLAPETTYKGSVEDNYAALRWIYRHAHELGVDTKRIAVMGESAGGGHAALLALTARDRGEVPVAFQALIYPMLDDRTASSRPVPKNVGTLVWTRGDNRIGWRAFLGQEPGTSQVPAVAVPARYTDLTRLPPAYVAVGSIDLFCDEDIEYARRLADTGIRTELLVVPGAFHGFDLLAPSTKLAQSFTATKMKVLKRAFAGQF